MLKYSEMLAMTLSFHIILVRNGENFTLIPFWAVKSYSDAFSSRYTSFVLALHSHPGETYTRHQWLNLLDFKLMLL